MSKIKAQIWDGKTPALFAHLKIDGAFLRIKRDESGEIKCLSSINTDLTKQITNCKPRWLVNLYKHMPLNSSILGELFYYDFAENKGLPASYIKTGLANSENYADPNSIAILDKRILRELRRENNALSTEHKRQLCFVAFALEYGFEGIDATSDLDLVEIKILSLGIEYVPSYNFRKFFTDNEKLKKFPSKQHLLDEMLYGETGAWLKTKSRFDYTTLAEGWMLKNGNLIGWKKVKKENTIDCFISGYVYGKGKYTGQIGSLICSVYNSYGHEIQIATAGGFSDEIRSWLTEQFKNNRDGPNGIIQQVIEVQYQFVATKGRLRHPRFKNWRDDKLKEECTTDQDSELVKYWG